MKIKIRKGIFETNSSSMHSIVVTKNTPKKEDDDPYDGILFSGKLRFWEEEMTFERYPFKVLATPHSKLGYVLANNLRGKDDIEVEEYLDEIIEMINNHFKALNLSKEPLKKIELPTRAEAGWFDSTDRQYDIFDEDEVDCSKDDEGQNIYVSRINGEVLERGIVEETYLGDIDHQSFDLFPIFMRETKISVEEFIFNPRYIVIIDGDEYCIYNNMVESGLINEDNIEKIYEA